MSFGDGGGPQTNDSVEPRAAGLNVQTSVYGLVVPLVYGRNRLSGNLLWYGAFAATPVTTSNGGGGGGGKGGDSGGGGSTSTTWTYSASMQIAVCEGPVSSLNGYWSNQSFQTGAGGFTFATGANPQSPWSYQTSNFPGQDLAYNGLAHADVANLGLGSDTSTPNFSFDITGLCSFNPGVIDGANPKDIVSDLLSSPTHGSGFPSALLGTWTQYSNYCVANGLFLSPVYSDASDASSILSDLTAQSNSASFFSEKLLKIVPYGDQAATGNGATYTPNNTIQYDVGDDDYIILNDGDDPVMRDRKTIADAFNQVQVEICDAANQYNVIPIPAQDLANIQQFGLRPDTSVFQAHSVTSQALGQFVAQFRLQRALYQRNVYTFTLGFRFADLEPMDLITLTDAGLGLGFAPVRILSVEDEDSTYTFTAEDYLANVSSTAASATQAAGGYNANFNAAPGDVSPPLLINAPGAFTETGFEVWAAISGAGADWGGCEVWVSSDNATYRKAGVQIGRARYGVLTAAFPLGADPDTVNQCKVDLTVSQGQLVGGTQADADNNTLLCYVDGELISYQAATLTAANKYTLGTYIRRGVNNTPAAAHPLGANFARLDSSIFRYAYDESQIGKTVYLKFLSFNKFNGALQLLSAVAAYPFTIGGSLGAPAVVINFAASQNGNVIVFQWGLLGQSNVDGYEIRYNPLGSTIWENGTPLTQVTRGTSITTAKVPPGAWTFMIKARDSSLQYSQASANCNLTVINQNTIIILAEQDQAWPGTLTNFIVHPTGVLVPNDQHPVSAYNWEWVDEYCPDAYATCTYATPEIDTGNDGQVRLHGDVISMLGPGESGIAAPALLLDTRTSAGAYSGFIPWAIGDVNCRYFKEEIILTTGTGKAFIQIFAPTADAVPRLQGASSISVAVPGTHVTFATAYRQPPSVTLTPVGTSGVTGIVHNVTATGFDAFIFDNTNTSVGGIANWQATGV